MVDFPFDSFMEVFESNCKLIRIIVNSLGIETESSAQDIVIIFHGRDIGLNNLAGGFQLKDDEKIIDTQERIKIGDVFLVKNIRYKTINVESQSPMNEDIQNIYSCLVKEDFRNNGDDSEI